MKVATLNAQGELVPYIQPTHFALLNNQLLIGCGTEPVELMIHLIGAVSSRWRLRIQLLEDIESHRAGWYERSFESSTQLIGYLQMFAGPIGEDSRLELEAHSPAFSMTYDEHNLLSVRGSEGAVIKVLQDLGFEEGPLAVPMPHLHQDRPEFDATIVAMLR